MLSTSSSIAHLPPAKQFDEFSVAYLDAARVLCQHLIDHPDEQTWPRAAACMFQARLATEQFLKAAILKSDPAAKPSGHDLAILATKYKSAYPDAQYRFHIPFLTQVVGQSGAEAEAIIKKHDLLNPMDQRTRYPLNRDFEMWPGVDGCDPETFILEIERIAAEIFRVRALIFPSQRA